MAESYDLSSFHYDPSTKSYLTRTAKRELGDNDVLIQTTHSGVCYTDVHAKSTGCSLGHEGIGIVEKLGPKVSSLEKGDRVGWGWMHASCGTCPSCKEGYRQYCSEARGFAFSDQDQGAFGDGCTMNADFTYKIPDSIPSLHAAPLMCAGASVFEALSAAGAERGDRIGVVGLGGLGHMATLFATAMGCPVTILSNGEDKLEDAFKLGATEFRDTTKLSISITRTQEGGFQRHESQSSHLNTLLVTSNAVPRLSTVLPLLARRATIVLMTIQQDSLEVPYMQFILPGHKLIASTDARKDHYPKMLAFAAEHRIQPWVEEFPMDAAGVKAAMGKLERNEIRFRGVLVREKRHGESW